MEQVRCLECIDQTDDVLETKSYSSVRVTLCLNSLPYGAAVIVDAKANRYCEAFRRVDLGGRR